MTKEILDRNRDERFVGKELVSSKTQLHVTAIQEDEIGGRWLVGEDGQRFAVATRVEIAMWAEIERLRLIETAAGAAVAAIPRDGRSTAWFGALEHLRQVIEGAK